MEKCAHAFDLCLYVVPYCIENKYFCCLLQKFDLFFSNISIPNSIGMSKNNKKRNKLVHKSYLLKYTAIKKVEFPEIDIISVSQVIQKCPYSCCRSIMFTY